MNMRPYALLLVLALLLALPGGAALAQALPDRPIEPPHLLKDHDTDAYRLKLLGLAWRAATSYPLNPHIKNRARAEEQVVKGALGIKQPHLAWGYAKQVVNWRKGACHAEIAHYLLDQGDMTHVEYFLRTALTTSKDPSQGWRHARVKARVAGAYVRMGKLEKANKLFEEKDATAHSERVSAEVELFGDEAFERLLAALDAMVRSEGYDEILAAMHGYADLYINNYKNEERRELLLARLRIAWEDMPGLKRFETLKRFVEAAIEHEDPDNAKKLLEELEAIFSMFSWSIDFELRLRTDIALLRIKLGQDEAARGILEGLVERADEKLETIQGFYRADAFRPVAEGFAVLGDTERAHTLYARVVELGAVNPNIRPRVSDITATCVSMALHGVEPDSQLLAVIEQIVHGLSKEK